MTRMVQIVGGAVSDFRTLRCSTLAASIAFFSLLSFLPVIFVILYGLSMVLRQPVGYDIVLNFLRGVLPTIGPDLTEEIKRVADMEHARWIIVVTATWFGMQVFYHVEYAINMVFGAPRQRHPIFATALSVVLLMLVGLLFVLSYLISQILGLLVLYAPRIARIDMAAVMAYRFLLSYFLPFALVLVAVMGLYRYLPQRQPAWKAAMIGALVFAVLWEVVKHLFTHYVSTLTVYSRMYGSLLFVVLFLVWIYYSAMLLLFGGALVRRLDTSRR